MFLLNKIIFFIVIITRIIITTSSYSWFGIWIGLEINLLSFIPLIRNNKNILTNESSIKYFIIQAIASTLFLAIIILLIKFNINTQIFFFTINVSILIKLGVAPFHFWFPQVIEGLSWINSLILISLQKITPIIIISYTFNFNILIFCILISSFIRGILGININRLRKLIAFSSINHISWIISTILLKSALWISYWLIYCIIIIIISFLFNILNIFYLSQLLNISNFNFSLKILIAFRFLNLAGIPPFLGFTPKWITIQLLISNSLIRLSLIIITINFITIFFYSRIFFINSILKNTSRNFFICKSINVNTLWLLTLFNRLTIITLIFNFF